MRVSTLFLTPFTKMLREDGRSFRALKLRLVNEPGNVTTNSKYIVVHKNMIFMIMKKFLNLIKILFSIDYHFHKVLQKFARL